MFSLQNDAHRAAQDRPWEEGSVSQETRPPSSDAIATQETVWVRRAQNGDRDAFDALVDLHLPRVLTLCQRLSGSRHEAEDASQEAFMRAWRSLDQFDSNRSFWPWISVIAQNTLRELWRTRSRQPQAMAMDDLHREPRACDPPVESGLMAKALQEAVQRAVLDLSPRQHQVFVLVKLEGKTASEAAEVLNITSHTVRWTLMEALKRVYQSVCNEGYDLAGLGG